jgi:tRNA(Ile)-lysidine synthase
VGPAPLPLGESVFDGRFLIDSAAPGHRIGLLAGHAARLPPEERRRLALVPAGARGALPAAISPDGAVTCPPLAQSGAIVARSLTLQRLGATLGAIGDEAALWRVAKLIAGP